MGDDFSQSVFLIASTEKDNTDFGTGFVIHQDGDLSYILTCRHVVEDVCGRDAVCAGKIQIADRQPEENGVHIGDGPADMAVLKVRGLPEAPPLPLMASAEKGDDFSVPGCYRLGRDVHQIRPVRGHFRRNEPRLVKGHRERVRTWVLDIEGREKLHPGYSGSPVIGANGCVTAMVTHMEGEDSGYAISIAELANIWPDMPRGLIRSPDDYEKSVENRGPENKKRLSVADARKCDRIEECEKFEEYFEEAYSKCHNQPQFYILPGKKRGCPDSLIRRFIEEGVKPLIGISPYMAGKVVWDMCGKDEKDRQNGLKERLFNAFDCRDTTRRYSLKGLCRDQGLETHKAVIVVHEIYASWWCRADKDLMLWYIRDYWQESFSECGNDMPLFLLFFNIIYPGSGEMEVLKKLAWRFFIRRRHQVRLKKIQQEVCNNQCACFLFEELGKIERNHVSSWLSNHVPNDLNDLIIEKERQVLTENIFSRRIGRKRIEIKQIHMDDVEDALIRFIKSADRQMSGLYEGLEESS